MKYSLKVRFFNFIENFIKKFKKAPKIDFKKFPVKKEEKRKTIQNLILLLTPLLSTPIFYFIIYFINSKYLGITIFPNQKIFIYEWFWIDLILQIFLAYFLLSFSKKIFLFLPAQFLFMGIFYIGNAIKTSFFGFPITAAEINDIHTIKALFYILKGRFLLYLLFPLIFFLVIFLFNFRIRKISFLFILILALSIFLTKERPNFLLELTFYKNGPWWEKRLMMEKFGMTPYFILENAHYFSSFPSAPTTNEVKNAIDLLKRGGGDIFEKKNINYSSKKRNIYFIVLESFWDVSLLKNAKFNKDPIYPEFRKYWQLANYSKSLSPTFAGDTSNAEYEILCGFPKILDGVYFDNYIKNEVPCLPKILEEKGYQTFAFHPDIPDFWNRNNIYPKIGFDKYFFKESFIMDDMNGAFLSDESLFKQSIKKVKENSDSSPKFVYILTYTGHFPYELNEEKRPPVIFSQSKVKEVERYANSIYYTSKELSSFIKEILNEDPDALLMIVGDHTPNLGLNLEGYRESGLMKSSYKDFTPEMFFTRSAVPLLIIDGQRGPQNIGIINHYEIPKIIFSFLGIELPAHLRLISPKENLKIRTFPFEGENLIVNQDQSLIICSDNENREFCKEAKEWQNNVKTITNDIILGHKYALIFLKEKENFLK
jgi:phosphoglycerol transferase MdoB-like AlkP superfamily enzyme